MADNTFTERATIIGQGRAVLTKVNKRTGDVTLIAGEGPRSTRFTGTLATRFTFGQFAVQIPTSVMRTIVARLDAIDDGTYNPDTFDEHQFD